jgi:hypothetical protein
MRYTLLEAVQLILSSMDSDEVDSYDDTVESLQVAHILKSVYYDLATDLALPEHDGFFELNASGSALQPTLMTLPTNCVRLDYLQYNKKEDDDTYADYQTLSFMPIDQFMEMQNVLRTQTSNVGQMSFTSNSETFEVMYASDRMPMYYTTFDDGTYIFDAYDSDIDTTLTKAKTRAYGSTYPTFTLSNNFAADLEPTQFSLWINRAKVRAFSELKQAANQEAAGEARRQKIIVQKRKRRTPDTQEVFKVARFGRTSSDNGIPKRLRNGM